MKFLNKGQTIQDQAKNLWPRSLVIPKFEENDGIAESDSLIHMAETAALKALHQIKDNHSRKVVLTIYNIYYISSVHARLNYTLTLYNYYKWQTFHRNN